MNLLRIMGHTSTFFLPSVSNHLCILQLLLSLTTLKQILLRPVLGYNHQLNSHPEVMLTTRLYLWNHRIIRTHLLCVVITPSFHALLRFLFHPIPNTLSLHHSICTQLPTEHKLPRWKLHSCFLPIAWRSYSTPNCWEGTSLRLEWDVRMLSDTSELCGSPR